MWRHAVLLFIFVIWADFRTFNIGADRHERQLASVRGNCDRLMTNILTLTPIQIHLRLQGYQTPAGQILESCLTAALREARKICGRDLTTGLPDPTNTFGDLGSWSGAMCYLTILDQIGKCYRPSTAVAITNGPAINKSLSYFTTLTTAEIGAIYALRNAFFHDFGLYNRHATDQNLQRTFTVDNHPTNPIVRLPITPWDGLMASRNADNNTYVNLRALGDLVEDIYQKLLNHESTNNLALDLAGGTAELTDRYIFAH